MKLRTTLPLIAVSVAALSACASGPRTPDEFRVVRKAPLTVPPDFNLRPPSPGESRPQELAPDAQARVALFGADLGQGATEGEKLLVTRAGGDAVDRSIRASVDFDSTQLLHKNRSFADKILSFGSTPKDPVIDPEAEAARLEEDKTIAAEVTGGGDVMIKRKSSKKLPGL
ncbi:MAG: DUF3035 domain-containing protein [Hyphomonadaceae bacterium]